MRFRTAIVQRRSRKLFYGEFRTSLAPSKWLFFDISCSFLDRGRKTGNVNATPVRYLITTRIIKYFIGTSETKNLRELSILKGVSNENRCETRTFYTEQHPVSTRTDFSTRRSRHCSTDIPA